MARPVQLTWACTAARCCPAICQQGFSSRDQYALLLPLQVNLWEAENAVQARYSLHQLQYLSAIIDTSAAKVSRRGLACQTPGQQLQPT